MCVYVEVLEWLEVSSCHVEHHMRYLDFSNGQVVAQASQRESQLGGRDEAITILIKLEELLLHGLVKGLATGNAALHVMQDNVLHLIRATEV